jgi:hypothetical protein
MRVLVVLSFGAALAGCSHLNAYDPTTPEGAAGQAAADQSRASAQTLCGPTDTVAQRDDTDGTRVADYRCERPKP